MEAISISKIALNKFVDCFIKESENKSVLIPSVGTGYVQTFKLEKGLDAKFWDCCFNKKLVFGGSTNHQTKNEYFTLTFFLNLDGLTFDFGGFFLKENIIWDTVFISTATNFKMHIAPKARVYCLSIRFSKRWLIRNLKGNNELLEALTEKITSTNPPLLLEAMSSPDKQFTEELFNGSCKKTLGTFYVKSAVLKIVWDFFLKLTKEKSGTEVPCLGISIIEIEKYLTNHLRETLPNLRDLARKFSISESTLKRHFKKRHGVNISTYFHQKKMECAHQLIHEKGMNMSEVAVMLGYKNVNNFKRMLSRHHPHSLRC